MSRILLKRFLVGFLAAMLLIPPVYMWAEESLTLSFGIVPQQNATKLARLWTPICKYLSKQTGYRFVFKTAKDIPTFEKRLATGEYDIAYMNPYHYTVFSIDPGYRAIAKETNKRIQGIIVVKKDSPYQSIVELAGKTLAKVGDDPAVTKHVSSAQQRIILDGDIALSDTPGILWPKIENENSSYRLAVTGAIKNTAIDFEDIALFAAEYLIDAYEDRVVERYKLKQCPTTDIGLLEGIGRKRGCLRPGGVIDLQRASELLIHDIRSGALGRLSFETPEMIAAETAVVEGGE